MSSEVTYPWFFFYRISRLTFVVFLPVFFILLLFYRSTFKESLTSQIKTENEESMRLVSSALLKSSIKTTDWCAQLTTKNESYSLVHSDGTLLCDTTDRKEKKTLVFSQKVSDNLTLTKIISLNHLKEKMARFDDSVFMRVFYFFFIAFFSFLVLLYYSIKPLGHILGKVKQFRSDIPFGKNLDLFYKKDEWSKIQHALNEADDQLKLQINNVKNENEKIAAILESIYDDIIAVDSYEKVLFFNSNFKRNFMVQKEYQEITPRLWHTFTDETLLAAFRSVLKDGKTLSLKGLRFNSSSSADRYFDLTITSLKNSDGKISGALGVFYDVTEFKLSEKMRADFVANVSHEIRTPLTSIKGYTQLLDSQKEKIDPTLHLFMEKIISNTERMISLFNDLLNLSVIESKEMIKFQPLAIEDIIEAVSENIKTNFPQKMIHISREIHLNTIRGDARLIEQVLANLLDNACKYSGDIISIKISTFENKDKAYIAVQDNGPGIPNEHIQRIFERFYRVDSSRESYRGTGLGLSIVKHIISKHGGKIWVESKDNEGSNFIIELPLA
jgi:two-component system phosphate regulon sensor histidine kinase PhoR